MANRNVKPIKRRLNPEADAFVVPDLPADMDLGEALDIYRRVNVYVSGVLCARAKCNRIDLDAVVISLRTGIPIDRMKVAVGHISGTHLSRHVLNMMVDRACELLAGGMSVIGVVKQLGYGDGHSRGILAFYRVFTKAMHRVTGEYIKPGEFRRMARAHQTDPFKRIDINGKKD